MDAAEAIAAEVTAARLASEATGRPGPVLIGVTGSVAAGKSAAAAGAAALLRPTGLRVEIACTDGFLWPNSVLEDRGLTGRKGFPESFDLDSLRLALEVIRAGGAVVVPEYSHVTYDVEVGEGRFIAASDVVLVDGLHLTRFALDLLDLVVHLDAPHEVLERWFVERLMALFDTAESDPESFYAWAVALSAGERAALAHWFWTEINLVNLIECIEPWRERADVVIGLNADHSVEGVDRNQRV